MHSKRHMEKETSADNRHWFYLAVFLVSGWLVSLLSPVLMPFFAGAAMAYLGTPLVVNLQQEGRSRDVAVTLVFLLFILVAISILIWVMPQLEAEISKLIRQLPEHLAWLRTVIMPWAQQNLGIESDLQDLNWLQQVLANHWQQAGGFFKGALGTVSSSGVALLGILANLVLIPVIAFYLLRDWDKMLESMHALIPRRYEDRVVSLARESDEVLAGFLRGQLMVMLGLASIYIAGLLMLGLDVAIAVGLIAGIVSFVPYLGLILGILLAGIASVLQFHSFEPLIWVSLIFIIGQLIEAMVLTPKFVGENIGLHPVAVIFAVMAGGHLFGFFGVLLALPAAAVFMVLLRHAVDEYKGGSYY